MKHCFLLLFTIYSFNGLFAQEKVPNKNEKSYKIAIGFWNVENLYDTINDPHKDDDEFTPEGTSKWGSERYLKKIDLLATAISQMATDSIAQGLSVLGLAEIENDAVLNDLVNAAPLKDRHYKIVHFDGPDARSIDPALLYNPEHFKVTKTDTYSVTLVSDPSHATRDELVVSGLLQGEPVTFIVNHWPSRRGGEAESKENRNAAAKVARHIIDSILQKEPKAKIILMGDLNDDPTDESITQHLKAKGDIQQLATGDLYDPMTAIKAGGRGTLSYHDNWNLFDQMIFSQSWLSSKKGLQFRSAVIFDKDFLKEASGKFKGSPFRTYAGSKYLGGYSDHLPVYSILVKQK